jgi:hypothetical protein
MKSHRLQHFCIYKIGFGKLKVPLNQLECSQKDRRTSIDCDYNKNAQYKVTRDVDS